MAIRTLRPGQKPPSALQRKIDQHWDMAGFAKQDGDMADAERHMSEARRLQRELRDAEG